MVSLIIKFWKCCNLTKKIMTKTRRDLINISTLTDNEIEQIFELAAQYLEQPRTNILQDSVLVNLFFEESTRTRSSFEIAAKNMGAEVINIDVSKSSLKKGETEIDTVKTLTAMQPNFITIRHYAAGAVESLAQYSTASIINSGDGAHAHPTQALLDAFTIKQKKASFKNLKIAICGDIINSRVARSNLELLTRLGAEIRLLGPDTLLPKNLPNHGLYHNLEEGIKDVDVIIMLRLQKERMKNSFLPSLSEYYKFYGLTQAKLERNAKSDVIVLHPGPMNRNVEIANDVADNPEICLVLEQVRNGVAVRQAILDFLNH